MLFETPRWAKQAVWYQVFPERFRNGDPENDPPRTVPWTHEWYKPYRSALRVAPVRGCANSPLTLAGRGRPGNAPRDIVEEGSFYDFIYDRRYGGDLQGVRDKLPYLRDLGVTAIYFNPILHARSLHKYDTSDYRHVDDHFAHHGSLSMISDETPDPATWKWSQSDLAFLGFLKEAHREGFRVILDGVFNHVGRGFWAFQDVVRNGRGSAFADWFEITDWKAEHGAAFSNADGGIPFHYRAWDRNDGELPRLRHDEALGLCRPVREHLFAVTRRWMDPDGDGAPSDGIDGWRLDVARDIGEAFWRDWRELVKSINPEALLVAEAWEESRPWLDGTTFDCAMNYPFARRCQRFFVDRRRAIRPRRFDRELREMLAGCGPEANHAMQNLIDSHDTDRAASMFMNPDLEFDKANRIQDNGPNYNPAKPTPECYERLRLLVTFQMTFVGAPMVYYGDEVGMYGADDPSNRKPMIWADLMPYDDPAERIEPEVFEHYRRMIAIRRSLPALQMGEFRTLLADDRRGVFAFVRALGASHSSAGRGPPLGLDGSTVVVVLNNSDRRRRLNVPSPWRDEAEVVRLDDPSAVEVVPASLDDAGGRPGLRPIEGCMPRYRSVDGRLRGPMLERRSGAVFCTCGPTSDGEVGIGEAARQG